MPPHVGTDFVLDWPAGRGQNEGMSLDRGVGCDRSAQTAVQLFRDERKLTACTVGEPSLTLLRNDTAFGLLLAEGAHEDSFSARLYLDGVTHLRVCGSTWAYSDFSSVALYRRDDLWLAEEIESGRFFPNPSRRAYHVVFISQVEFARLQYFRAEGVAYPVFEFAQRHFGQLPGFAVKGKSLSTPDDYAIASEAVPPSQYVLAT